MTNAPEHFDSWILPDGVEKVTYKADTKIENCGVFRLEREDHTLANLLRMQLIRDRDVVFVGYKHPHPLDHHIELRVQTSSGTRAGKYLPPEAVRVALMDLSSEISRLSELVKRKR